jgi:uncharacterized membrane protein HdeD (DUF308 family)
MSQTLESAVLGRLGRHWGWVLAFGIVTVLAGIAVLAWPAETLLVIAVLFGVELVIYGIYRFITAFGYEDLTGGMRVLYAIIGMLSLIVGLIAIRHVGLTLAVLAVMLGVFWVVNGTLEIFTAAGAPAGTPGRGWTGTIGVLSVLAGIIVLAYPGISLLTLAAVMGAWFLVLGIMEIVTASQLRSVAQATGAGVEPASI